LVDELGRKRRGGNLIGSAMEELSKQNQIVFLGIFAGAASAPLEKLVVAALVVFVDLSRLWARSWEMCPFFGDAASTRTGEILFDGAPTAWRAGRCGMRGCEAPLERVLERRSRQEARHAKEGACERK